MDLSEQWNTNHHGYREGHSTLTTMLQMTDILYESTDLNMITAMITIDETSAFDCVPHDLLLRKMSMYNFHKDTTNWFGSYLKYRTNYVTVSGSKSTMLHNDIGVPQGSVLGPLLFTLFINEITETIKDPNCANISHLNNTKLFGLNCPLCGHLPCYADDATYLVTSNDRQHNQDKLNINLARLKEFLNNNGLTMNEEKTTVTECMVAQKRAKCRGTPPSINATDKNGLPKIIQSGNSTRILGMNIQDNLHWNSHLEEGEKAVLPILRSRLGQLRHIGHLLPAGSRLTLANGMICSKLHYLIGVWGGAHKKYVNKVQTILNKTARAITNLPRKTPTLRLMKSCNWLTANELIKYHSTITMWKLVWLGIPHHLTQKLEVNQDKSVTIQPARIQLSNSSFRWRAAYLWNSTPMEVRHATNIVGLKKQIKKWIIEARPPD